MVPKSSICPSSSLGLWHSSLSGGVVDWIVGRIICVQVVRHIFAYVVRLYVVYITVCIGVCQFGTRSILVQNFLVLEFVHGYFGQFQNTEAQIDRSIDDYFRFLFSNR